MSNETDTAQSKEDSKDLDDNESAKQDVKSRKWRNPRRPKVEVADESRPRPKSPDMEEAAKRAAVMSVDFDAILKHIGEMGRYQQILYIMMCIPATLPAAFLAFNQVRQSQAISFVYDIWLGGKNK